MKILGRCEERHTFGKIDGEPVDRGDSAGIGLCALELRPEVSQVRIIRLARGEAPK